MILEHVETFSPERARTLYRWLRRMPVSYMKDVDRESDLLSEYIEDMEQEGNLNTFVLDGGRPIGFIQAQPAIPRGDGSYYIHFLCPRDLPREDVYEMFDLYREYITKLPLVTTLFFRIHRLARTIRRGLEQVGCQVVGKEPPHYILYWWHQSL